MKNICIVPLIGIPGAGKTTLVKFMLENMGKIFPYYVIHINYDVIVQTIKSENEFINESYTQIRNNIVKTVYYLVQTLKNCSEATLTNIQQRIFSFIKYEATDNDIVIVVDDTSYYRSMRYEYYKICKLLEISFYELFIKVDLTVALQRNSLRGDDTKIPVDIIERMAQRLEIPSPKNHWEEYALIITSNINDEVLSKISLHTKERILQPLKYFIKPDTIVEQTLLHKLDLSLRKYIHETLRHISCNKAENMQSISSNLNEKRKELLNDVKHGLLVVTDDSIKEFVEENMKFPDMCSYLM